VNDIFVGSANATVSELNDLLSGRTKAKSDAPKGPGEKSVKDLLEGK